VGVAGVGHVRKKGPSLEVDAQEQKDLLLENLLKDGKGAIIEQLIIEELPMDSIERMLKESMRSHDKSR